MAKAFWDHVFQISIRKMHFSKDIHNYEKLKSFVETFTPYSQILIIEEPLWMSSVIFIFDTDPAQINSVTQDII